MPRLIVYSVMLLLMLALIPPVVAARTRASTSEKRPIHIIQDMDIQAKFKAQTLNPLYADQRSMRPEVVGAVARGETLLDTHLENGVVDVVEPAVEQRLAYGFQAESRGVRVNEERRRSRQREPVPGTKTETAGRRLRLAEAMVWGVEETGTRSARGAEQARKGDGLAPVSSRKRGSTQK